MPKQIGNKILILGGGRWGQITYNNLFDEAFIEKLQIISKSLKLSKSILKDKNIKIQKKIDYNKIKNYNLISICKNNISKLRYLKKLYNFKNILVIEKPLIIKKKINRFLLSFSKRKFFLSLPWYFETKIKNNIDKFINKKNANNIKFIWFDNSKKKYGLVKNFDKKITYTEDIFSHIFSILFNEKLSSAKLKFLTFYINRNIEYLSFNYGKIRIEIECSNKINKKYRKIIFNRDDNKIGHIKILDKYFYVNDAITKINSKFYKNLDTLKLQYKFLLNKKNHKEFKNLSCRQILYQNHLFKLCNKFLT